MLTESEMWTGESVEQFCFTKRMMKRILELSVIKNCIFMKGKNEIL